MIIIFLLFFISAVFYGVSSNFYTDFLNVDLMLFMKE